MAAPTQEEIQGWLDEAWAAYRKLILGSARVIVRTQDGRSIEYAKADANVLLAYIRSLEALLTGAPKRSRYFRMTQTGDGL